MRSVLSEHVQLTRSKRPSVSPNAICVTNGLKQPVRNQAIQRSNPQQSVRQIRLTAGQRS